jgi:hypothetical protein
MMQPMRAMPALASVGLLSLMILWPWRLGARAAAEPPTVAGPFEITPRPKKISAGGFPNTSSNPFARTTVTVFGVKYRGKPVAVPGDKTRIDEFWDAVILQAAPRPAVLAALGGVYLMTEDNGQLRTVELAESSSDIASIQILDGQDGQPSGPRLVTIRNREGEPRAIAGGTLLLLNRSAVLDVRTLKSFPVRFDDHRGSLDDYNASGEQVRAVSPGRTQLVAVGHRDRRGGYEYALIAAEFATGRLYAVPFDRTATRLESVWDATPDWMRHYFAWTTAPDGREQLALRKGVAPRPWMGRFSRFGGGVVEYRLEPARPEMLGAFLAFLEREYKVKSAPVKEMSETVVIDSHALRISYRAEERKVTLYADGGPTSGAAAHALVEKIGTRFNAELSRGEHQSRFGAYDESR